jgi:flagellar basal-body rod protein FlgB
MLNGIEAITNQALRLALDAASLRQQAIATNIANVHTPGYQPLGVDFESQLAAARRQLHAGVSLDGFTLAQIRPALIAASGDEQPAGVRLDMQAADLAENSVRYQALLKGLSRQFSILTMAVGDGRK